MAVDDLGLIPQEFGAVLREHNFRAVQSERGTYFDQAFLVLASDALRLRFARDRGSVSVDIGDTVGRFPWYPLFQLRYLLLGCDPGESPSKAEQADFLRDKYSAIDSLFATETPDSLAKRMEPLNLERRKKLMALLNKFKR